MANGHSIKVKDIEEEIKDFPTDPVPKEIRKSIRWNDPMLYIYTSGTTGTESKFTTKQKLKTNILQDCRRLPLVIMDDIQSVAWYQ